MQQVDLIVWRQDNAENRLENHKLNLTMERLKNLLSDIESLKLLERFKNNVYRLIGAESSDKEQFALDKLDSLIHYDDEQQTEFKALTQFKQLFDVANSQELLTKVNELYIFTVEVRAGIFALTN